MSTKAVSLLAASLVVILLYQLSRIGRRPKGYPPGPSTLPVIGNLHIMPKEKGHLQFEKWVNEYGPIYSLILGTQVMVVLSSDEIVKDLLDKRSGIYSSRPDMYLSHDIASGGLRTGFTPYGETWRINRGILHKSLNIIASRSYVPYQDLESKAMLLGFLEQPSQFFNHIQRYSNSISTQITYGFRTIDIHDPKLEQLIYGFGKWSELAGSQTAAFLDVFPMLRRLPDALLPVRRYAKNLHKNELEMYLGHYLNAKRNLKGDKGKPCIASDIFRAQEEYKLSDNAAGYLCGTILEAGSDTSASTLIGFTQALLIFPEVLKLAQTEIDKVCGDRIPDFDDLPDLPYIRGCVKESLRWMPTTVLGVPHATICDDEYLGYKIPKGARVVLNVWAIHNNPSRYPEPRRFDPSRWANDSQTSAESANNRDPSKRDQFGFGAGRRICQGIHIADQNLFLAISRLVWAFDFKRPINPYTGEEIVPDMGDLAEGLLVCPKPFNANIEPRSASRAEAIKAEWDKMTELLDDELQWKTVPEGLMQRFYETNKTETDL
ncbi:cytochrome P450 [Xylaria digitata]|nr:cytochrome P450 [Xylaria digitata]